MLRGAAAFAAAIALNLAKAPALKQATAHLHNHAEGGSECFWPVAVSTRELTCVVTSEAAPHPPVAPRPMHAVKRLQVSCLILACWTTYDRVESARW